MWNNLKEQIEEINLFIFNRSVSNITYSTEFDYPVQGR